jgi:uncharacterized protein YxeA
MKKILIAVFLIALLLVFSASLGYAETAREEGGVGKQSESIQALPLKIESLALSGESPMLGETLRLLATIRNDGSHDVNDMTIQFYQGERKLGSPTVIEYIEAENEVKIELPFRPSSVGRYTITAVITPSLFSLKTTDRTFSNVIALDVRKDKTFLIKALPTWWSRLNNVLEEAKNGDTLTNYSRMEGLEANSLCKNDVQAGMVLQKYGQAFLDALSSIDQDYARKRFADALNELSKFAEMLYCIDLPRLQYWDRAIASFWQNIAENSENSFSFNEAILATWNPALLVLDAIQHTGFAEIISTFQEFSPLAIKSLMSYPTDTYGAAWLDAFGMGQLVRISGQKALDNLREVLSDPYLLGLGMCPLASHAQKIQINRHCFDGIEQLTAGCTAADLSEFLSALNETGMLMPLLEGNLASASASSTKANVPSSVSIGLGDLTYFGTPVSDFISGLCAKLKSVKPKGLQGLAKKFGTPFSKLSGCGFAMLMEGLSGAGGEVGGRITQCIEKYSSQIPSPIQATQVSFPVPECGWGREYRLTKKDVLLFKHELGELAHVERDSAGRDILTYEKSDGSGGKIEERYYFDKDGKLVTDVNRNIDKNGVVTETGTTVYKKDGSSHTQIINHHKNGKTITDTKKDQNGKETSQTITEYDKNGKKTSVTKVTPPSPQSRPVGPGDRGCGETAAMQRARMIFNCIFSEGETAIGPGASPAPVSYPIEPKGDLPVACDAIDPGSYWGSSTSVGGGAYDPPRWQVGGGPAVYERFIPQIDGVIDPPKEWTTIPRAGNLLSLPE